MPSHSTAAGGPGLPRAGPFVGWRDREKSTLCQSLVAFGVCCAGIAIRRVGGRLVVFESGDTRPGKLSWARAFHRGLEP